MYTNLEPTQLLNFSAFQQTFYNVFLRFISQNIRRWRRNSKPNLHVSVRRMFICRGAENLNKPHAVFFLNTTQQTPPHCFLSRIWTFTVIVNCFFVKIEGFSSVGRQFVSLSKSIESDQILVSCKRFRYLMTSDMFGKCHATAASVIHECLQPLQ